MNINSKPILVLISADAEWNAVKEIIRPGETHTSPYGEFFVQTRTKPNHPQELIFFQGGWGKISAAGSTQYGVDRFFPSVLFNLGTCGGIAGRIERGQIVLVESTVVYDLIEMMEASEEVHNFYTTDLDLSFFAEPYPFDVKRQTMFSADRDILAEDIPFLVKKYGATVCDWESAAIAFVAKRNSVPLVILRGVSDLVSQEGGEAYGNLALFHQSTYSIMENLVDNFEYWLDCVDFTVIESLLTSKTL
ncbi:MAG: 5'-methylthioadenosine/S-adenosylhomocysteine nucleosidase [Anaerolineales bacterium]|nr:5'-methylthioadenosine/S-adenosylhomocysteine nucleosidase [Anaerolineales bacterium]